MTTENTFAQPWAPAQKWGFQFAFIFFLSFILMNPNGAVPLLSELHQIYIIPMHKLIVWAGANLLHLPKPITQFTAGSGDTTYDWLVLGLITLSAFVGATIWSLVSRKPMSYDRLYYWLLVILRFYVGFTMLTYGAVKVVKLQFPMPGLNRLLQPYGDSSPMGLAWTFIGYSKGYNYFTGMAELLCGGLLLFRRTVLIGAIIAFTVSANIVAINYCYDVPVKIVSSMLLLMTIFILLKDLDRIIKFFFLNQIVPPAVLTAKRFKAKWKNVTLTVVKSLLIAYLVLSLGGNLLSSVSQYGDDVKKPLTSGIFNTQTFVLNNDTLPPLTTDTTRWKRVILFHTGWSRIYLMNDSTRNYNLETDTVKKTLKFYVSEKDTAQTFVFKYILSKDSVMQISGKGPHGMMNASFKRFDDKKFLLMRRGFHWVNEFPLNR